MQRVANIEPWTGTLLASEARTGAQTNTAGSTVQKSFRRATFLFNVTVADTDAGDTLDVYVDVLGPDGTTWLNAVHFPQIVGTDAAQKHYAVLDASAPAATTFNVTADCDAGVTKPYLFGTAMRARYTIVDADADGSFTFSVKYAIER